MKDRMIYPVNSEFVISENGTWIPGSYESEEAARLAFDCSDIDLHILQNRKNEQAGGKGGTITLADVQALHSLKGH